MSARPDGFVVDIKPSARRANGAVGATVNRRGSRRWFEAREDAESWAAGLSEQGERKVWVRAANPNDAADVDGYLVSRRPRRGTDVEVAGADREQRDLPDYRGSEDGTAGAAGAASDGGASGAGSVGGNGDGPPDGNGTTDGDEPDDGRGDGADDGRGDGADDGRGGGADGGTDRTG